MVQTAWVNGHFERRVIKDAKIVKQEVINKDVVLMMNVEMLEMLKRHPGWWFALPKGIAVEDE